MSEEDKIQKFFRTYLTENKIKQDFAEKIIKQAEQYETKHRGREFLGRFFDALQKSYDSKNPKIFIPSCKRFLFVINKLLGDVKKEKSGKYNEIISQQIVQYYLFFSEIIFKNHLHELIVDLKMYRMKWAKLITDTTFIRLKQEVQKKHKFNLNRGFSEENMEKIKKIHQKRGLTQKQSNYYLGIETIQQPREKSKSDQKKEQTHNSSESSSESDNDNGNGHKKIKTNFDSQSVNTVNPIYSGYGMPPSYNSMDSGSYDNSSYNNYVDPRFNRQSNGYPSSFSNTASNPYLNKQILRQQTPRTNPPGYPFPPPTSTANSIPQTPYYPYQNYPQSSEVTKHPAQFREVTEPRRSDSNFQKIKRIRKQLQQNFFKCRQCGSLFETGQNHDKHMTQHFFNSLQKVNQAELKGKMKKESKIKLLDIKIWQFIEKSQQKQYRFQVQLSQLPEQKNQRTMCYFCNQELEISFSPKYEDWVYSDAVKINDSGKMNIIHYKCYECFKSDQNSPEES